MGAGAMLWGWDLANWQKVRTDLAGHLQVDVLTSGLPAGGATAANQALIIADTGTLVTEQGRCYGYDTANWQYLQVEAAALHNLRVKLYDGANGIFSMTGTAARVRTTRGLEVEANLWARKGVQWVSLQSFGGWGDNAGNADERLGVQGMLYGYNGASWDRLRVESNVAFNLRVKLYDGANGIDSEVLSDTSFADATRGLVVNAALRIADHTSGNWIEARGARSVADASLGLESLSVGLMGFTGASWYRLRTYGTGILKVGRAEVGLLTARMTGTGQVGAAGARKLYWMAVNPSAGNSVLELTDNTDGAGTPVFDHFHTVRESHIDTLDPPMEFSNGIYIKTFTATTSVIFGYL